MPRKPDYIPPSTDDFLKNLAFDLRQEFASEHKVKNIIEFIEDEIDHDAWGIKLLPTQIALLKAFYSLDLTDEERNILLQWTADNKTSWEPLGFYQALILEVGRRGGKTTLATLIVLYEFYKLCYLPVPQKHYGISISTSINILVLATTAQQTKDTIFGEIQRMFPVVRFFDSLIKRGKIEIQSKVIIYKEKALFIKAGNSSSAGQVGGSIILLVMDEVARFESDGVNEEGEANSQALELWSNLGKSGLSFGNDAKRLAISSAWEPGDAIEELGKMSKLNRNWLSFSLITWELNTKYSRNTPIIDDDYKQNPKKAALEYENIRSAGANRFFDAFTVKKVFIGRVAATVCKEPIPVDAEYALVRNSVISVEPFYGYNVLAIDPSISKDTYALAMGHAEKTEDGRPRVVIDVLIGWTPKDGASVSLTNVQQCILKLNQKRPIAYLHSDHHGSGGELIERMRLRGINAKAQFASNPVQLAQYELLRHLIVEERIVIPKDSPWQALLYDELCRVKLVRNIKIDHDERFSKDMADAVAAVCSHLVGKDFGASAGKLATPIRIAKVGSRRRESFFTPTG